MDNRVFDVNGRSKQMLGAALALAFQQEGERTTAKGYVLDPARGMILLWHDHPPCVRFLDPLDAEAATEFVWDWLKTRPEVACVGWDEDADHDGHNERGWRVFCEGWGHVAGNHYAIVAVKPAYLWMGK